VLRNVGGRDAAHLRRGIEAMKRDVRARSVPLAELRGQTLSNFGMFGGRFAALVILSPRQGGRFGADGPTRHLSLGVGSRGGGHRDRCRDAQG
jgi:hypothetical protein